MKDLGIKKMDEGVVKKYNCPGCSYKFKFRHGTSQKLQCPNCGTKNVIEDTFNLNKMIKDL